MNIRIFFLLCLQASFNAGIAQQILNAYGKVTSISGTSIELSNVNETYDEFAVGENVLIMQMQDNVIGENTGNNEQFGNIADARSAGIYEKAVIESISSSSSEVENVTSEVFTDALYDADFEDDNLQGTIDCNNCNQSGIRFMNGNLVAYLMGGTGYWYSNEIDIAGYSNVAVSMDVQQQGYDNWGGADLLTVSYSLDGGNYIDISELTRAFAAQTVTIDGLSGSSLIIRVYMDNDNGDYGIFDNVLVTGDRSVSAVSVWEEDFEDLNDGDTEDNGATSWSSDCGDCNQNRYFEVTDADDLGGARLFAGNRMTDGGTWTSEVIDIAAYLSVVVSVDVAETGFDNGTDNITVSYRLNETGGFNDISTLEGGFNNETVSLSGISGTSLEIRVEINSNQNNDIGMFDNVSVKGEVTASVITLTAPLTNTFNIDDNSSVQIISFPRFDDYTTTSDLTALPWDGNIGGVFALDVRNTLTLEHAISVDELGFAGGGPSVDFLELDCEDETYRSNSTNYGQKGEGIYKVTNNNYRYARGKLTNGGGGGSHHNAGGGGGANFTQGGEGGPGYNQFDNQGEGDGCDPGAGGLGGADLSSYISSDRMFMGGGGGGGQQNDGLSILGGAGGGIVIIRASTVQTNAGCSADVSVTANGEAVGETDADGGSGAGAGGSIFFQVDNWSLDCTLTIEANGGDGSDIDTELIHGGGGGGGKGVIIFSVSIPTTNLEIENNEGEGGLNSNDETTTAESGESDPSDPDADSDGIVASSPSVTLPVELIEWEGVSVDQKVFLSWVTLTEENNDYFTLYRSLDGVDWTPIATIEGQGTSREQHDYSYQDAVVKSGITYYRLSQTDYDGQTEMFDAIAIQTELLGSNILLHPNPNSGVFTISVSGGVLSDLVSLELYDSSGNKKNISYQVEGTKIKVNSRGLASGNYLITLKIGAAKKTMRVIIL